MASPHWTVTCVDTMLAVVLTRSRKIRGKLNVPRERFRLTEDGEYVWAGKRLQGEIVLHPSRYHPGQSGKKDFIATTCQE